MEVPEMVAKLRRLFALDTDDMEAIAAKLESLAADYDRLRAERDAMVYDMQHIAEYWNGSRTDGAMYDALDHILGVANKYAALSLARDLPADGVRDKADRLRKAVHRLQQNWSESSEEKRQELWRDMGDANRELFDALEPRP